MSLDPERLGAKSRSTLLDPRNRLYLSIVSVWEMMVKSSVGKLNLALDVQTFVRRFLPVSQAALLDLSLDHVFALASVPDRHRDPFDRMLVAQAAVEGMGLMTADQQLLSYPIFTIDARE